MNDAQVDFVNERMYALGMSAPADYLRKLLIEDMRRMLREFAQEVEAKQRQLDASGHSGVGADLRGVGRNVIERDEHGFPTTVQTR